MKKTIYAGLMVASLMVVAGCNKSTEATSSGGGKFSLKAPTNIKDTEVKQGEKKMVTIDIDESKDFKEEVTLSVMVDPSDKGVTASLDPKTVKGGDAKKTELKIEASDKASAGKYVITVKGKAAKGAETSVKVDVKVPEPKK